MKRILLITIAVLITVGYVGSGIHFLVSRANTLQLQEIKIRSTTNDLKELQLQYKTLDSTLDQELQKKTTDAEKLKQLESEKQKLDERNKQLEEQLQARLQKKEEERKRQESVASSILSPLSGVAHAEGIIDCANQNSSKAFIYCHESDNNPGAYNAGGCRGLGQACPGSKLPCTDSDYLCQDQWFTNYMSSRYGTWDIAKAAWQSRCGSPQGCWW